MKIDFNLHLFFLNVYFSNNHKVMIVTKIHKYFNSTLKGALNT